MARRGKLTLSVRYAGSLDLTIPPFLKIDHDIEARKAVLTIEDDTVKQQKEMWGA